MFGGSEAELSLVLKARNLASKAIGEVGQSLDNVTSTGGRLHGALDKLGSAFDLLTSGPVLGVIGALLHATGADKELEKAAGALTAKLATALAPTIQIVVGWIQRTVATISTWIDRNQPLINQITTFVGSVLARLISVLGTVIGFLGRVIDKVAGNTDAMNILRGAVGLLGSAVHVFEDILGGAIGVIGNMLGAIGNLIQAVKDAIWWLNHLSVVRQVTAEESAAYHSTGKVPGSQSGGWVGLRGPELRMVGEAGPEYVIPNHRINTADMTSDYELVPVRKRDLERMMDERMYFSIKRAAPSGGRV